MASAPLIDGGPHGTEPRNAVIYEAVKDGLTSTSPAEWRTSRNRGSLYALVPGAVSGSEQQRLLGLLSSGNTTAVH